MKIRLIGYLCIGLFMCGYAIIPLRADQPPSNATAKKLHALFEREWEYALKEYPEYASRLGDRRYNTQWTDTSLEAIDRRQQHAKDVLEELAAIDKKLLSNADQLNYTLFKKDYELGIEEHQYRKYLMPLSQMGGIQTVNQLADALRFETIKDYQDWIARLRSFSTYMDQTIALMAEGIKVEMVPPEVVMKRALEQIDAQIVDNPAESLFFKPFEEFFQKIDGKERQNLISQAQKAIEQSVIPSFRKLRSFFVDQYLPVCTEHVGVWQLPKGKQMYAFYVRKHTSTEMTPEQIHELGQQEIKRIRTQMDDVIKEAKFDGSFDEFLEFLHTDSRFYYETGEELLIGYQALCKRIDPMLMKLFKTLPRMTYGVEAVPEDTAPYVPSGYYRRPADDGSRPGTFFINLYNPQISPKYEMEVLALHESVPGHHFQLSLAMEMKDLPNFRRHAWCTAYGEGWALYCESLGDELGFYKDPYSKFGQLSFELWRAIRLVVDTGIHHLGWTRQQAIDLAKELLAKNEHKISNEIDRYIVWPGQALAYKIGQLKIKELRKRAEDELGEKFDIREFHDLVLANGTIPLDVLETQFDTWLSKMK